LTPRTAPAAVTALLPGEDIEAPEAAERWIRIYEDLVAIHEVALGRLEATDIAETAVAKLRADLAHFRQRLEFWRRRQLDQEGVAIDAALRRLSVAGRSFALTVREQELLDFLLRHRGRGYLPRQLAALAWGDAGLSEAQVRNYVVRLRRLLDAAGAPIDIGYTRREGHSLREVAR
jgi:DNA-binding response OmpR family regulator